MRDNPSNAGEGRKKEMHRFGTGSAKKKTYSTRDSLVVTDPTTSLAISGLSMGERTGSRVFHYLWPYVQVMLERDAYIRCPGYYTV